MAEDLLPANLRAFTIKGICRLIFGTFYCWLNLELCERVHQLIFQLLPLFQLIIS
jgi:hypothetical protein